MSSQALLEGRLAVITAAASGMGRAAALRFAEEGARVIALDVDAQAGEALEADARAAGHTVVFRQIDLTDLADVDRVAAEITSQHRQVDVLYNHAGIAGPRGFDFDTAAWERTLALNLTAPVFLTKALLPALKASIHGASVLFTSSTSGLVASPNSPLYSCVKSGILGFMRAFAASGGPDGIRSNAICPGTIETPMLETFFRGEGESVQTMAGRIENYKKSIPLGRLGVPRDTCELALFLASSHASYITGAAIPVDGGYVAV